MSPVLVAAILFAAVLHASWNAVAKSIPDRLVASTLIGLTFLVGGAIGVFFMPTPAAASIPFIACSALVQTAYLILLTASYRHGDFGQVYPLSRGLSVLLVTLFSTFVLGEYLDLAQTIGVACVIGALGGLVLFGGSIRHSSRRGVLLAVLTGITIAIYTLIDGVGVRTSGSPLGYASWMFLAQGLLVAVVCYTLERDRASFRAATRRYALVGFLGGLMSLVAYAIVLWAQSLAPLALVSALRETSVLLAGIIGFFFFKERLSAVRILMTVIAAAGIVIMQVG